MKDDKDLFDQNMITDSEQETDSAAEEKVTVKDLFTSRSTRKGGYSVGLSIVVVAIAVVLSLLVGFLPENLTKFDISDLRIYETGDTTKQVVSELDKNVEITVIADLKNLDSRIKRIVDKYDGMSNKISAAFVDPVVTPSVLELANTNNVYVYCPQTQKSKTISFDDIIQYDMYTYYSTGQYDETIFDGEGQLTGAIVNVTDENPTTVYALVGHGESELGSFMADLITKQNISLKEVNLISGDRISKDEAEVIIVNGPTMDITEAESKQLADYLASGGTILYFGTYQGTSFKLNNLNALFATYGIVQQDGFIRDNSNNFASTPTYIVPKIDFFLNITSDAYNKRLIVLLADQTGKDFVVGFEEKDAARSGAEVYTLLESDDTAERVYVDENGENVVVSGKTVLGYFARKTETGGGRIFAFSDVMIDDVILSNYSNSVSNATIIVNVLAYSIEGMANVSIPGKSLQITYNTIPNGFALGTAYMIIIPVTIMVIGLAVWLRRRRV